jgi:4-amino-4-deoxy-L-arabinose transferase-like glycosyltransferase
VNDVRSRVPGERPSTFLDRIAALNTPRWWLLLVATALVARLVWVAGIHARQPRFDEVNYIAHAERLVAGLGYVDGRGHPTAYWPVGYPAVMAFAYSLLGQRPLTGILLQMILGTATCIVVCSIGTDAFSLRIGRLAALLLAVYPTHVFYSTLYLTEPLFTLLLVAAVAMLHRRSRPESVPLVAAGLTLGLAALVRPVILLLPLMLPAWFRLEGWSTSKTLYRTAVAGICTLLAVSPWLVRNHAFTRSWFVISTTGGQNFWMGNHPGAFGGYAVPKEINEPLQSGSEFDPSRGYQLGLAVIRASPIQAAVRALQKVSYFFALETDGVLWNLKGLDRPPPLAVTLLLLGTANAAYVFVVTFAVLGLVGIAGTNRLASLFLLIAGYLVLIAMVFVGDPRYHYALVPLAIVFAAKGVAEDWPRLAKRLRQRDPSARRTLLACAAILAVFVVLMVANLLLKVLESQALSTG